MHDPSRELLVALVALRKASESRLLEIRVGDVTTCVEVKVGAIVAVSSSKPSEPIGRILRRKNLISTDHYVDVLERLSDALAAGESVRFGEVAVGLGYVQAEDVAECLTEQVRSLLVRVFQSTTATWSAKDLPSTRDASRDSTLHAESIFLDAIRWLDDERKGALGLSDAKTHALRPQWSLSEIDEHFDLTTEEAAFLRVALAGDKTVQELRSSDVPDSVDIDAVLTAVLAAGAVASKPRGEALKHGAAKTRARAPFPAWTTVDLADARAAAAKAIQAKESVRSMKAVAAPQDAHLRAEQSFFRGKEFFRENDLRSALAEFELALNLNPRSAEYELFAKWCQHIVTGKDLVGSAMAELERRAHGVLSANPEHAFGYFVLGEVRRAQGKAEDSRALFMRALRIDKELFEGVRERRSDRYRPARGRIGK